MSSLNDEQLTTLLSKLASCPRLPVIAAPLCAELRDSYKGVTVELLLLVTLLCVRMEDGDVCLRLEDEGALKQGLFEPLRQRLLPEEGGADEAFELRECLEERFGRDLEKFTLRSLEKALSSSAVSRVEHEGDDAAPATPLVYALGRLYFRRYYGYESVIARFVRGRARQGGLIASDADLAFARECVNALFGVTDTENRQRWAAALALLSGFTVISGGPGTGKTTTVSRILLILLSCMIRRDPHKIPRVLLCAPTGKAAGRLGQSLESQLQREELRAFGRGDPDSLDCPEGPDLISLIPTRAETVHRLLGVRPHSPLCRHNANSPLNCDILVVDEVSMVDLPLMAKLCAAVGPQTVLVLLGDKDQLCSVEAGSVMADLCQSLKASEETSAKVAAIASCDPQKTSVPGSMSDHVMLLTRSYRFDARSGIGTLARLVNGVRAGDDSRKLGEALEEIFQNFKDVEAHPFDERGKAAAMRSLCEFAVSDEGGYRPFLEFLEKSSWEMDPASAARAFALLDRFRILCSNRGGLFGTQRLNALLQQRARLACGSAREEWFPGRVVMVTRNNPAAAVHNGDVGFCALDAQRRLRVWFPDEAQGARAVNPVYLTDFEDGYAMTVHKSQGSEYERVALCLSERDNAVLTRELVYTGITRAKGSLMVYASEEVMIASCLRSVQRESGLAERLG